MNFLLALLRIFFFLCSWILISPALAGLTETIKYPIPGHGYLQLNVPVEWFSRYHQRSRYPYPLIVMYAHESQPPFQLSISVFWHDNIKHDITDLNSIKEMLLEIGGELIHSSIENQLILENLNGQMGNGYYFDLSDASESIIDFPYIRQGALSVGQLLIVFAYFDTDEKSIDRNKLNLMLETAIQIQQRHVNWPNEIK